MLLPTGLHLATLEPHALVADTHILGAPVQVAGKFTVTDGVFAPEAIVAPPPTVQL